MTPRPVRRFAGAAPKRVAIDTGGTFTDLVAVEGGKVVTHKVPSTPGDPSRAFFQVVEAVGGADLALHGTTIVVNALLEGKTARAALVTTAGFEDVEEIGRQDREDLYALHPTRTRPVIPRGLRIGVRERVGHSGEVITPLTDAEVRRVVAVVRKMRAESVAVCLLHSYANPAHERRLAEAFRRAGFAVSESHRVLREFREYERTAVTTLNARALPLLSRYAGALQRGLHGTPLGFLRSNGGLASPREVQDLPVATIASGPAGGALGARALADATRLGPIVTFDMGGTSTDAAVIDGVLPMTTESSVLGIPVPLASVDVRSVGAGGGSIARIRGDGVLRVGPESAGADPGPVCYGRGEELTVTDANVALGRCDPRGLLGGDFPLHADRLPSRLERLGRALGMRSSRVAEAIVQLAQETMSGVLRLLTVRQGLDPRRFALFTFGGAGGLHAVSLARALGMREVVVPRLPGAFSAFGMLFADAVHDVSETVLAAADDPRLRGRMDAMARCALAELKARGLPASRWRVERSVDLRYEGQSFELRVPFGPRLAERFVEAHRARYGFVTDRRVVAVTLRARAVGVRTKPAIPRWKATAADPRIGAQRVTWGGATRAVAAFDRERLRAGAHVAGPALVLEYSATTWVPPGASLRVDPWGSLRIAP